MWVDWLPAIAKGIGRWVLVGGAAAERRDTIAAGKAHAAAVKRAGRARWWARFKEDRLRMRAAAAAIRARVRWAKAVLKREKAEGGVACEYDYSQERWPPIADLSPGVAVRDAAETERAMVALADRRVQVKRAREEAAAKFESVALGADGGPGASARGRKVAKCAVVAGADGTVGGWRVVRGVRAVVALEGRGQGEGLPSPEVLRRLRRDEARRRGASYVFKPGTARRLLAWLVEQRRAKARKRERGRVHKIRVALLSRFARL